MKNRDGHCWCRWLEKTARCEGNNTVRCAFGRAACAKRGDNKQSVLHCFCLLEDQLLKMRVYNIQGIQVQGMQSRLCSPQNIPIYYTMLLVAHTRYQVSDTRTPQVIRIMMASSSPLFSSRAAAFIVRFFIGVVSVMFSSFCLLERVSVWCYLVWSFNLTRVTRSYLLALGATQISSFFTKHWTKFLIGRSG